MSSSLILLGSGGHARVLTNALHSLCVLRRGYLDLVQISGCDFRLSHLGNNGALDNYSTGVGQLVAGIGSYKSTQNTQNRDAKSWLGK